MSACTPPARPGRGGDPKNSFSDSRAAAAAAGGRGNEASGVVFRVSRKNKNKIRLKIEMFKNVISVIKTPDPGGSLKELPTK